MRTPSAPISAPDSAGYLAFAPIHSLGYPLFLQVVGARGAILIQPLVFAVVLAYLGIEILNITSSVLLAAGVVAASILTPELTTYHASILTESLFMSGSVMFLALTIRFTREPSLQTAILAATTAGVTATVRRTAYAFLPILVLMVFLQWRRVHKPRAAILAAAIVPMLAVLGGERIALRAVHGNSLTSLLGRHMFAKAAMIDAPRASSASADPLRIRLEEHLDVSYATIRDVLDRAPRDVRTVLTLYYEGCLQGPCVPELGRTVAGTEDRSLNDALAQAGLARIARAPINAAKLTATHYRSLWTVYKQRHPDTAPALNTFIASNRPLPFEREAFALTSQDTLAFEPSEVVRFVQPVVVAMGWITAGLAMFGLAAAAARRAPPAAVSIACLASLTAHGCLLLSALLASGLSRFTLSMWPSITTAMLVGAWFVVQAFRPASRRA